MHRQLAIVCTSDFENQHGIAARRDVILKERKCYIQQQSFRRAIISLQSPEVQSVSVDLCTILTHSVDSRLPCRTVRSGEMRNDAVNNGAALCAYAFGGLCRSPSAAKLITTAAAAYNLIQRLTDPLGQLSATDSIHFQAGCHYSQVITGDRIRFRVVRFSFSLLC